MLTSTGTTGFYQLGFAAQMIVWAARKRLHLLSAGTDDSHVIEVFRLAKLDGLYEALMSILNVLACGSSDRIQLHGVSCPCLSPHEVSLLNALAHLQAGEIKLAQRCIAGLMGAPAAWLVWPALSAIVNDLDDRALWLAPIADFTAPEAPRRGYAHARLH